MIQAIFTPELKQQGHRLSLFLGTWFIAGVIGTSVAWKKGWNSSTEFGKFGEAVTGIADVWAVVVGASVPIGGALIALAIAGAAHARANSKVEAQAWEDMKELSSDAVAVFYNALSFAGVALFSCGFFNVYNDGLRWASYGGVAWLVAFFLAIAVSRLPVAWRKRNFRT